MARRLLPVVLLLSACASTPPRDYRADCIAMGYTGNAVAQCAQYVASEDQARRLAAFQMLMQNPPLKWQNVQPMPAPIPIGPRTRLPCRQIGNQLVCDTQ